MNKQKVREGMERERERGRAIIPHDHTNHKPSGVHDIVWIYMNAYRCVCECLCGLQEDYSDRWKAT